MTDDVLAPSPDNKQRLMVIGALVVVLLLFGGLYLAWASGRVSDDLVTREARAQATLREFEATNAASEAAAPSIEEEPTPAEAAPAEAVAQSPAPKPGEVLVVNRVPGDDYGRMAIRHVDGTRTLLDRTCVRVHMAADRGVCLSQAATIVPNFATTFFDATNPSVEISTYPSALPSRARLSPSGSVSSVTAFVSGASYEDISSEASTLVTIYEIGNNEPLRSASQFVVDDERDRYGRADAQYWGMTFVDDDEFYITGFYGDDPEIMHGFLETMTITPTGWEGSCPSVSPDGTTVVYKELRPEGGFDLVAVDIATERRWIVGETRSADDQVEWLDNDTILYALHPDGGDKPVQPEFDIWMIDIAEGSEPVLFLPNADSPAVAR